MKRNLLVEAAGALVGTAVGAAIGVVVVVAALRLAPSTVTQTASTSDLCNELRYVSLQLLDKDVEAACRAAREADPIYTARRDEFWRKYRKLTDRAAK